MRRDWLTVICMALVALAAAAPAEAAFDDPLFVFTPNSSGINPSPPPAGHFSDACGLAVNSSGNFYVADYYHRSVDLYDGNGGYASTPTNGSTGFLGRPLFASGTVNPHTGPLDDPCGLAVDAAGTVYVNNYHRNVVRFPTPVSPSNVNNAVLDSGDPSDPYANPTGVAVDAGGNVYVDDRTYIAAYDSTGAPLADPKIGDGTLGDGYGVAVSEFAGSAAFPTPTAGFLYVPDSSTDTVKVYDPATDPVNPVPGLTITGPPTGGFGSLQDSAVAVDNSSGEVYVIDTLGPQFSEQPQATVYVFDASGAYEGRLKHNVVNAIPSGLAVSGSGRVYVTSGLAEHASIYAYPPGAATSTALPPQGSPATLAPGAPGGSVSSTAATSSEATATAATITTAAASSIAQEGTLRVAVGGELRPKRLPRAGVAPIAVSVGGKISTTDASLPPQLKTLRIELNRNGRLSYAGLPTCPHNSIQPGSTSRALSQCRAALIGKGSFTANITLAGQEPYPTEGKLTVFNAIQGGKPVLFGHIYAPRPFATSFVIVFKVQVHQSGTYGTVLDASLPDAMEAWGRLTGLQMTLSRRYRFNGEARSYLSSGCPAPEGFGAAVFPLVRTSFLFDGGEKLSSTLTSTCKVRRSG